MLRAIDVKSGAIRDEWSSRGEFGAVIEAELGGEGGKGKRADRVFSRAAKGLRSSVMECGSATLAESVKEKTETRVAVALGRMTDKGMDVERCSRTNLSR